MTYCVAIGVNDGLVFASDTRTSAGVDDVRTYSKMHVFEFPGERSLVVLSAGNLATTHAILAQTRRDLENPGAPLSLRTARCMYDAAEYLGGVSTRAQTDTAVQGQYGGVDLRVTLILGGQIRGEPPALYLIYPEGNCIWCSPETPYLQLGESKYGKPILDRIHRLTVVGLAGPAMAEALDAASDLVDRPAALYTLSRDLNRRGLYAVSINAANRLASASPLSLWG